MIRNRSVLWLLILAMLTGLLAGCGGEKSAGGDEASSPQPTVTSTQTADSTPESTGAADPMNPVGQYPIMKEKITVSMMASKDVTQPDDWNDLLVFQRLEELTNVHFDFQVVSGDAFPTQMNVKLASNSYPDVLARGLTTDDEDTYGPAGKFIDLTDLIDQYMPNLQKLRAEIPDFKAAMTTTDGKIYGLGYYFPSSANVPITSFFNET